MAGPAHGLISDQNPVSKALQYLQAGQSSRTTALSSCGIRALPKQLPALAPAAITVSPAFAMPGQTIASAHLSTCHQTVPRFEGIPCAASVQFF